MRFEQDAIFVLEPMSRPGFEADIRSYLEEIETAIDRLLAQAGTTPAQVDAIFTTGGSSLIPIVRQLLARKFGAEKVRKQDEFTSVVSGLALAASQDSAA